MRRPRISHALGVLFLALAGPLLAQPGAGGAARSCRGLIDHVTAHHAVFTAGAPQFDDITMVALRLNGGPLN